MERISAKYQFRDGELPEFLKYLEERGFVVSENLTIEGRYGIHRRLNPSSSRIDLRLNSGRIEGNQLRVTYDGKNTLFEVVEEFMESHPSRRDGPSFAIV
ncbi:MAG TPA: hypothetical protein ENH99_00090 [Candidatus Pacearchaeota archaeon]|nr:hypothetical protein [Candidatus Pacearchaeota archaeon]